MDNHRKEIKMQAEETSFVEAFVPAEILEHFSFDKLEERSNVYYIYMTEKDDTSHRPWKEGVEFVKDGYARSTELQTYPIAGHEAFICLRRRRWKKKGTTEDHINQYDLHDKGLKCTRQFGVFFLKEIDRV